MGRRKRTGGGEAAGGWLKIPASQDSVLLFSCEAVTCLSFKAAIRRHVRSTRRPSPSACRGGGVSVGPQSQRAHLMRRETKQECRPKADLCHSSRNFPHDGSLSPPKPRVACAVLGSPVWPAAAVAHGSGSPPQVSLGLALWLTPGHALSLTPVPSAATKPHSKQASVPPGKAVQTQSLAKLLLFFCLLHSLAHSLYLSVSLSVSLSLSHTQLDDS